MPQAPDELRDKMLEYYQDRIDDSGPTNYLKSKGWTQSSTGWWTGPYDSLEEIPEQEWLSILFLIEEWDHAIKAPRQ